MAPRSRTVRRVGVHDADAPHPLPLPADLGVRNVTVSHGPDPDGIERFSAPCGCTFETDYSTEEFRIRPCSETCTYYAYFITESRKQGKPIEIREVDE